MEFLSRIDETYIIFEFNDEVLRRLEFSQLTLQGSVQIASFNVKIPRLHTHIDIHGNVQPCEPISDPITIVVDDSGQFRLTDRARNLKMYVTYPNHRLIVTGPTITLSDYVFRWGLLTNYQQLIKTQTSYTVAMFGRIYTGSPFIDYDDAINNVVPAFHPITNLRVAPAPYDGCKFESFSPDICNNLYGAWHALLKDIITTKLGPLYI